MRQIKQPQMCLGEMDIGSLQLDKNSRDDIPQILRGLQELYMNDIIFKEISAQLKQVIPEETNGDMGRPGMDIWNIFVLGTLRLNLNCDYDRVMELANEHKTLRQMLGHSLFDDDKRYGLQTIKDNVRLLTSEILDSINQWVVRLGHEQAGIADAPLTARCDSFVFETDVHFPTDISLLLDAMRKVIILCGRAADGHGIEGWRQYKKLYKTFKKLYHKARRLKHSTSKDEQKKEDRKQQIQKAHQVLIDRAEELLQRAEKTLKTLQQSFFMPHDHEEIQSYMDHAYRQIDQIDRRVIKGETIPHHEKCFSLFEEHTEWISKGKAGVPVELGVRVCILEDSIGYILHHHVMEQETDDKIAILMVDEGMKRFPLLRLVSFDKGFYTPANREQLQEILEKVVMPKKGKWSQKDKNIETEEEFVSARKQHSAVESAINALEVHGLDRCPDQGIDGFKRYVALAVVARNIQKLGATLLKKEKENEARKRNRAA